MSPIELSVMAGLALFALAQMRTIRRLRREIKRLYQMLGGLTPEQRNEARERWAKLWQIDEKDRR